MKLSRTKSHHPAQFQARLEAQRRALRQDLIEVDEFPRAQDTPPSIFKSAAPSSFASVDELVEAGNRAFGNLDNVDFAGFRNNKELGERTLREVEKQLLEFHADRTTREYKQDLSRVLNARYLQGHGVQVESHLDHKEMRKLRLYLQREGSSNDVADAVRAINSELAHGEEDVAALLYDAEKHLYTERGLPSEQFDQKFGTLGISDLRKVRSFSDAWSTSQGGKFLKLAHGSDFNSYRDSMAREMLAASGYKHVNAIDLDTALSLLRDIDSEGPRTNAAIRDSVNRSLAEGEKDYFVLNATANQAILQQLGVSQELLASLDVSDEQLSQAYPDLAPREARAIRAKVLRDLMRVLPKGELEPAMGVLAKGTDLITAEARLSEHFAGRIDSLSGESIDHSEMGAMQKANLATALSKMPEEVRLQAFTSPDREPRAILEELIEGRFGIEVHRQAGIAPDGNSSVASYVKDWTIQGLVDLYNAMSGMAKDGKLPETLIGNSTIAYVEGGGSTPSMLVGPQPISSDPVGPWNQPGAYAHQSGTSGYYGMCSPDQVGHDTVYFCDDALMGANGDSARSVTIGESTIIHEFGHAIQLGGTPGKDVATRNREQQLLMAEWSSLSEWNEPEQVLADGFMGDFEHYYDPTVQVGKRDQVATSYGASDPCEDFAEYTPYFFKAPQVAIRLSAEKFLYLNDMVGGFYSPQQLESFGLSSERVGELEATLAAKLETSAARAGLAS